jgi:hypothetical protein
MILPGPPTRGALHARFSRVLHRRPELERSEAASIPAWRPIVGRRRFAAAPQHSLARLFRMMVGRRRFAAAPPAHRPAIASTSCARECSPSTAQRSAAPRISGAPSAQPRAPAPVTAPLTTPKAPDLARAELQAGFALHVRRQLRSVGATTRARACCTSRKPHASAAPSRACPPAPEAARSAARSPSRPAARAAP